MTIVFLKPFVKDYSKLPQAQQRKVDKQLRLLKQNVNHPGLKARKMVNQPDIYEARVDLHFRMTFKLEKNRVIMRRVGTHKIYKKP